MESSDSPLEEYLRCSICLETYSQPKLLACHHTFCCQCLDKCIRKRMYIECPLCKQVTTVKSGTAATLTADFRIEQLKDVLSTEAKKSGRVKTDKYCDVCKTDGKSNRAQMLCLQCSLKLCKFCCAKHDSNKLFVNHHVVDVEEDKQFLSVNCAIHPGQQSRFFCRTCPQMLCAVCSMEHSDEHAVEELTVKTLDTYSKRFESCSMQLLYQHQTASLKLKYLNNLKMLLQRNFDNVQDAISSAANRAHETIEKQRRSLVDDARARFLQLANNSDIFQSDGLQAYVAELSNLKAETLNFGAQPQLNDLSRCVSLINAITEKLTVGVVAPDVTFVTACSNVKFTSAKLDKNFSLGTISNSENFVFHAKALTDPAAPGTRCASSLKRKSPSDDVSLTNQRKNFFKTRSLKSLLVGKHNAQTASATKKTQPEVPCPLHAIFLQDNNLVVAFECHLSLLSEEGQTVKDLTKEDIKPRGLALMSSGNIAAVDRLSNTVKIFTPDLSLTSSWNDESFSIPFGLTSLSDNNVAVTDIGRHQLGIYDHQGSCLSSVGLPVNPSLVAACEYHITSDSHDNIALSNVGCQCISLYNKKLELTWQFDSRQIANGTNFFYGVCFDGNDDILVCDSMNSRILKLSSEGILLGEYLTKQDGLKQPYSIFVKDSSRLGVVENHKTNKFSGPYGDVLIFRKTLLDCDSM